MLWCQLRETGRVAREKENCVSKQEQAYKEAGERIKQARLTAALSQEALSLDADLDQSTLSKVERLGPHIVSWRKLEAIAAALGCVVEVNFKPIP